MRSLFILVTLVFSGTFFAESTMQCNFKNELGEALDEKISDSLKLLFVLTSFLSSKILLKIDINLISLFFTS